MSLAAMSQIYLLYRIIFRKRFLPAPVDPLPESLVEIVQYNLDQIIANRYPGCLRPITGKQPTETAQYKESYKTPANTFQPRAFVGVASMHYGSPFSVRFGFTR